MATQKPISTISYNSEPFLKERLDEWLKAHIIQSYMYIKHKGEDGDKDHIHLRIEPNKRIDPMCLTESLKEYDPKHPDKPLCVRPWRPSAEEDWIMYSIHDKDYLARKYESSSKEKLPYSYTDIVCSEGFDIETAYIRARQAVEYTAPSIVKALQEGTKSPVDVISQGASPFIVNAVYKALTDTDYKRLAEEYKSLRALLADHNIFYDVDNRALLEKGTGNVIKTISFTFE